MLGFGHNHFSQHNLQFMQAECWPQFHLYGCEIHGTCYMLYSLPISSALIRTMITSINAVSKKKSGIKPDPRVVETLLPMRNGYKSMLTTIGQETIAISVPLLLIGSIRFYGSCWKISICYTIACYDEASNRFSLKARMQFSKETGFCEIYLVINRFVFNKSPPYCNNYH